MDRKVDSLVILVVDALRFDFALYNLPQSIGRRLQMIKAQPDSNFKSRLLQFVADPPTVTMQRLKALTTGGLPTFADISGNMGGASVDEDSWVRMLRRLPYQDRGLTVPAKAGFVGDDTWVDMYPEGFTDAFPYPSFNTRDLNTVDNGCEKHIPDLLKRLRKDSSTKKGNVADELELMVVHFLGVDHVGHTYGPHNKHMDDKLRQMDDDLTLILDTLDNASDSCHMTLIFGDHGMTEDGNHGGGTEEEIAAALFVHASKGCPPMEEDQKGVMEMKRESDLVHSVFGAIHQIDLVPTITSLLGLPIPFANLGGLDPTLLPGATPAQTATALALNAAQVWRYFTVYSETANRLPGMPALEKDLRLAVSEYTRALNDIENPDSDEFNQAAMLLKGFLNSALALGQNVWTRFDDVGMGCGIVSLALGLIFSIWLLLIPANIPIRRRFSSAHSTEVALTAVLMLFTCGLCTFSNSYILEEENSIMYALSVLSIAIALRMHAAGQGGPWKVVLTLPILSRLAELLISGHGYDPSILVHTSHHAVVFLSSLIAIGMFRSFLFRYRIIDSFSHMVVDLASLFFLGLSWWEKRQPDPTRNGYLFCRIELFLLLTSMAFGITQALIQTSGRQAKQGFQQVEKNVLLLLFKLLVGIMTVTGPSAAASMVVFIIQISVLWVLAAGDCAQVRPFVLAALLRLVTRHAFFATNHGCTFSRLQLSAAFAATSEFYFEIGGISLFLNTFGWEMVGIVMAWFLSQDKQRLRLWRIYGLFQLVEALTSCISVSILRRHLMVWDIYAPHFLFAGIFTVLHGLAWLTNLLLTVVRS